MVEVFLLGVLVSLLKLGSLATLTLGTSFWAFVGVIVCLTAALATLDQREFWANGWRQPDARMAALLAGRTKERSVDEGRKERPDDRSNKRSENRSRDSGHSRHWSLVMPAKSATTPPRPPRAGWRAVTAAGGSRRPRQGACPRCHAALHPRKVNPLARTVALSIAALSALFSRQPPARPARGKQRSKVHSNPPSSPASSSSGRRATCPWRSSFSRPVS